MRHEDLGNVPPSALRYRTLSDLRAAFQTLTSIAFRPDDPKQSQEFTRIIKGETFFFQYLPSEIFAAMAPIGSFKYINNNPEGPKNIIIPTITGRSTFEGHHLLTNHLAASAEEGPATYLNFFAMPERRSYAYIKKTDPATTIVTNQNTHVDISVHNGKLVHMKGTSHISTLHADAMVHAVLAHSTVRHLKKGYITLENSSLYLPNGLEAVKMITVMDWDYENTPPSRVYIPEDNLPANYYLNTSRYPNVVVLNDAPFHPDDEKDPNKFVQDGFGPNGEEYAVRLRRVSGKNGTFFELI